MNRIGSLWEATGPPAEARPALAGDTEADVAIVGAGYTGLWTAYYLAQADPGLRIVVLEAEHVGFGASGRNGGWASPRLSGLDTMLADPRSRRAAASLQREMYRTVAEMGAVATAEGIECDWHRGGAVVVATRPAHVSKLRAAVERRRDAGLDPDDYRWLDPQEAATHVRTARNLGATFTPHCAALHPLALAVGLADAVERRGVRLHEQTPVLRIDRQRLATAGGVVRADVVVAATEAWSAAMAHGRRRVVPLYSLVVATEPLDDATWAEIGLADRQTFADGRHLVIYGQRTADGRIAFGGRGAPYHFGSAIAPAFDHSEEVFSALRGALSDLFPVLSGVSISHRWGGPLAISRDWTPTVTFDRDTGLAWAGAYGGQGVAAANLAGRLLTDLVLGRDTDLVRLPVVGHHSRTWEPEPLRWLGINAGLRIAASVDAAEARGKTAPWRSALLRRLVGL